MFRLPLLATLIVSTVALGGEPTLDDLAWMAGSWAGKSERGVSMEEVWTAPAGGMMLGLHRDVFPDGKGFFEYLRVEAGPEGIDYLASPRGAEPTAFHLVQLEGTRAVFEKADHDWPKRIIYTLEGSTLCSVAEGDEDQRRARWCWERVKD